MCQGDAGVFNSWIEEALMGLLGNLNPVSAIGAALNPVALLGTGLGMAGDIYSAYTTSQGEREANEASLTSAREQMDFQERMSNTAHQREVADLRAAGLNPVLSANSGASTPVGTSVDVQNSAPNLSGIASRGVQTALQGMQMKKDFESADAQIAYTKANKLLTDRNAEIAIQTARQKAADADISAAERVSAQQEADFMQKHPHYMEVKKAMELVSPMIGSAGSLSQIYRNIKGYVPERKRNFKKPDYYEGYKGDLKDRPNADVPGSTDWGDRFGF